VGATAAETLMEQIVDAGGVGKLLEAREALAKYLGQRGQVTHVPEYNSPEANL